MKIQFLLPLALIAVTAWLTNEAHAGQLSFYADTARVTLSAGTQYNLATGYNAGVQVHDSNGQSVYGIFTQTAYFYLQGSQVVGYFNITIPSPGTYSFSFPAQGGGTTRYYTTPQLIVDQGNGWFAVGGGQVSWFRGEAFPYTAPQTYTYDPYATPYPSGPSTIIKPPVNYLGFQVPIERVGHSFNLKWKAAPGQVTPSSGSAAVTGFVTSGGLGPTAVIQHLLVSAPRPSGSIDEWWIFDSTAGQESVHRFGAPGTNTSLLGDAWTQVSGVPKRYFAIPDSRRGHSLIMGDNNNYWTAVSQSSPTTGTYSNGTYGATVSLRWIPVDAIGSVTSNTAFIVDLTSGERTIPAALDARAASVWFVDSDYSSYPHLDTNVTLPAWAVGHKFAVHRKASNGPELSSVYAAVAAPPNAKITFPVEKGLRFWVTREAENGATNQPVAPVGASAASGGWVNNTNTNGATFSAISPNPNLFTAVPNRPSWAVVLREVRVNQSQHAGNSFKVTLGDGYTTTYAPPGGNPPTYSLGQVSEWNGATVDPALQVYTFTAQTDWRFNVTLLDHQTGGTFSPTDANSRIDWLAPWVSPTLGNPPGQQITLQLPFTREYSIFARADIADATTGLPYTVLLQFGDTTELDPFVVPPAEPPAVPIAGYEFDTVSVTLTNPLPDVPGSFPLIDITSDDLTPVTAHAQTNTLQTWFKPPGPVQLKISSSRYEHVLRLCHPNGESFPITRGNIESSTFTGLNGTEYVPYYFFNADTQARTEMPWYIEDLSTEPVERIGPSSGAHNPTDDQLITWYHLPTPNGLTGAISVGLRRVELVWSPAGASMNVWAQAPVPANSAPPEGAFEIERQLTDTPGASGTWLPVAGSPFFAGANTEVFRRNVDGLYHFKDPVPDPVDGNPYTEVGKIRSYRVRYKYGTNPVAYSGWSNFVSLTGWRDVDGDGMPDAWEMAHFGSLDQNAGGGAANSGDKDGDGISNLAEFLGHTNPNALPAGTAGSTLVVYTPLQ